MLSSDDDHVFYLITPKLFIVASNAIHRLRHFVRKHIGERLINLNLFQSEDEDLANSPKGRIQTRFFLVMLMTCAISIGFYLFVSEENQLITVMNPSEDT
jgi:hypothetical protein